MRLFPLFLIVFVVVLIVVFFLVRLRFLVLGL